MSRKVTRKPGIPKSRPQTKKDAEARYAELETMRRHCLSLLLIPTQLAQALKNTEILNRVPDLSTVVGPAEAIAANLPVLQGELNAILNRSAKLCSTGAIGDDQMFKLMGVYGELHEWTLKYANTVGNDVQLLSSILGPIEQQLSQAGATDAAR